MRLISFSAIIQLKIYLPEKVHKDLHINLAQSSCQKYMVESSFLFLQKTELLLEEAKPSEMDLIEKSTLLISGRKGLFWSTFILVLSLQFLGSQKTNKQTGERNYKRTITLCCLNFSDSKFGCLVQMAKPIRYYLNQLGFWVLKSKSFDNETIPNRTMEKKNLNLWFLSLEIKRYLEAVHSPRSSIMIEISLPFQPQIIRNWPPICFNILKPLVGK